MPKPTETRGFRTSSVKQLSIIRTTLISMTIALLIQGSTRANTGTETLESIHTTVIEFVEQQYSVTDDISIRVGKLDQRLRLSRCSQPLESDWAPGSSNAGRATVAIRCTDARPWKLYVPVRITHQQYVAVTARPMIRGQRISQNDLIIENRSLEQQRGVAIQDPGSVEGHVMKHSIAAGKVLLLRMISAPKLVERGQRVVLTAASPGLNINMKGIALEDGQLGDRIKVRNPVSKRVIHGIVFATGIVQTGTP